MGRCRGAFDDFLEFSSRLPLRTSVILTVVSFVFLHVIALTLSAPAAGNSLGNLVVHQLLGTLAKFLQFVIPAGFLIGAAGSALGRSQGRSLFKRAAASSHAAIADMSWGKFERLVGDAFRLKGYDVVETGGQGSDGGFDLVLTKDGGRVLVQCKHWKARPVGVTVVRRESLTAVPDSASGRTYESRAFAARSIRRTHRGVSSCHVSAIRRWAKQA